MEQHTDLPWTSGAKELLSHGLQLLKEDTDVNRRLAMISIDNAVEIMMRAYFRISVDITGIPYKDKHKYDDKKVGFHALLKGIKELAPDKLLGIESSNLQWYHNLRNTLYHEGNGISVERQKVIQYAEIAKALYDNLFDTIFPDVFKNKIIALIADNWQYVYTDSQQGNQLVTHPDYSTITKSGIFTLIPLKEDKIALKAYNNKFVGIRSGEESELIAERAQITEDAIFKLIEITQDDNLFHEIALQSYNRKFVMANLHKNGRLEATAKLLREWEILKLVEIEGEEQFFKALEALEVKGWQVNPTTIKPNETISITFNILNNSNQDFQVWLGASVFTQNWELKHYETHQDKDVTVYSSHEGVYRRDLTIPLQAGNYFVSGEVYLGMKSYPSKSVKIGTFYEELHIVEKDIIQDGAIIQLRCQNTEGKAQWLCGDSVPRPQHGTASLVMEQHDSRTWWKVVAIGDDMFALQNMGAKPDEPKWLDGDTTSGTISLVSEQTQYTGTRWKIIHAETGIYKLKCLGHIEGVHWLEGIVRKGQVTLTSDINDNNRVLWKAYQADK